MEHSRFVVEAPRDGNVYVIDVTTTSTVHRLDEPAYAGLAEAIVKNIPLLIQAEPVPVFYRASNQSSGVVSANATVTPTGTANQQGGMVAPNQNPPYGVHFSQDTRVLIAVTATGSGHLRLSRLNG